MIRAHAHAAGIPRHQGEQALGRSRSGFSTIERSVLDPIPQGRPAAAGRRAAPALRRSRPSVALHLTGGERHDLRGVAPLVEQGTPRTGRRGRPRWKLATVIADHAYSAAWSLEAFRRKRIVPVIPSRADQPENPDVDREGYRQRNLIERLVGKLEQLRRVAIRHDKLDAHDLTCVQVASAMLWLRAFGDTA